MESMSIQNPYEIIYRELAHLKAIVQSNQYSKHDRQSDEVFKMKEAAAFLKIGINRVRNLIKTRQIPFHKEGKEYRFLKSKLIEWVNDKTEDTAPEIEQGFDEKLCS